MKRSSPEVITNVHVRASIQQHPDNYGIPLDHLPAQDRLAGELPVAAGSTITFWVSTVHIACAKFQKPDNDIAVATKTREDEETSSLRVLRVRVCAVRKQGGNEGLFVPAD